MPTCLPLYRQEAIYLRDGVGARTFADGSTDGRVTSTTANTRSKREWWPAPRGSSLCRAQFDNTGPASKNIAVASDAKNTAYNPWLYAPVKAKKPGALRNGAPFEGWALPAAIEKIAQRVPQSRFWTQQAHCHFSFVCNSLLEGLSGRFSPSEIMRRRRC